MSHNEIEKAIKTMNALTLNAKEVLQKLTVWATTTESTIDFVLLDQSTGGYTKTALTIPTAFSLNTPYWGSPFISTDRKDSFIDKLRFYSNEGGWVFDKQISIPEVGDPNYLQVADTRFWEFGGSDILSQYYYNDVATYTHVAALFRNKTTRFTYENTLRSGGSISNARNWYSYIDITGYSEKGYKTIMHGYSASINFGGNDTYAKFYNKNVYIGYSALISSPASVYASDSLNTINTYIDGRNAVYIGCNSIYTPYSGADVKHIFIGADDTTYIHNGNTEIGINGAKLYTYARDALWYGRALGTNTIASATNVAGRNVNIATYSPTTGAGAYVYLRMGDNSFNLVKNTIGYIGLDRYSESYTLSAKLVAIAQSSLYAGFGNGSSGMEIGYGCKYANIARSAAGVDAFTDAGSVLLATSRGYTNGYLEIGTDRKIINLASGCDNLNIGGTGTSAVFSGDLLNTKDVRVTEINSIDDTIIKGGKENRYGSRIPTVISGMWNDSKYNLRKYHAEVIFHKGGYADPYDNSGEGSRESGYVWNKVKHYEVGTNNIKIRFQLFDIGGGIKVVYARCVKTKDVPQKVYICSATDTDSIISDKTEISSDVMSTLYDTDDYMSPDYNKGVSIHIYYERTMPDWPFGLNNVENRRRGLRFIEIHENVNTGDIIIRTITHDDEHPFSFYKNSINNIIKHKEVEPGCRRVCTIGKTTCVYTGSINYSQYEYGAFGVYTDSAAYGNGNADMPRWSADIFGWGTWGTTRPNGSPIYYDMPSHFIKGYLPTATINPMDWMGDPAVSDYYAERPLIIVHAYSDVSSIYAQYKCVDNVSDLIHGSFTRPGMEAMVIAMDGNYRTAVLLRSFDNCGYAGIREISRFLIVDGSAEGKRVIVGGTDLIDGTTLEKMLYETDYTLSPVTGANVMQYTMSGSMTDTLVDVGVAGYDNNWSGLNTVPALQRYKINADSVSYILLDKSDFGTSVTFPKIVDVVMGYNLIEGFRGQL
jgi:hypothetical protein